MAFGKNLDTVLQLKLDQFFKNSRKAQLEYQKVKKSVEGHPIQMREVGSSNILRRVTQLSAAYIGLRKVVSDYTTTESNLANVASLGVKNIEELGKGINDIAKRVPVALHDIETGLYDVVSAGVDASNQIDVLEASAKAARAGIAETSDALKLGSAVIKGYGQTFADFSEIMDLAFQTVKLGQTTFPELAASMGAVIPLAATLQVSTEELFGAFATLTGVTGNTAEVATQLRGILAATAKPTGDLTELFKDYGGAAQALQEIGLAEYLKIIADETRGNAQEMTKYVPRVEGLNATLALSGPQFDTFLEKTEAMRDSVGAADEAFAKQADTLQSKLTRLDNSFQIATQSILVGFAPAITDLLDAVADLFNEFSELDEGTQKLILALTALVVLGPRLLTMFRGIRTAIIALNSAIGPAGWLIIGVGLLVAAWQSYTEETEKATAANRELKKSLDEIRSSMIDLIERLYESESLEILTERQEFYNEKLDEAIEKLDRFAEKGAPEAMIKRQEQLVRNYQAAVDTLDRLIEKRKEWEESLKREEAVKNLSISTVEPGKLQSDLEQKTNQLANFYTNLIDIDTQFNDLSNQQLDDQYNLRRDLLNRQLTEAERIWGRESEQYRQLILKRWAIDLNYAASKRTLEQQTAEGTFELLADFALQFQGISKELFEIGKAASIAQAIVKTYEGAALAVSKFVPPLSYVMAAAQIALGFAQVAKIRATKYEGKAAGGIIRPEDIARSALTPHGESGLIGVQTDEFIMNRGATKMFRETLEEMNRAGLRKRIPGYQEGGQVTETAQVTAPSINLSESVSQAIIEGFDRSRLEVAGRIELKGNTIQIILDKERDLKSYIGD